MSNCMENVHFGSFVNEKIKIQILCVCVCVDGEKKEFKYEDLRCDLFENLRDKFAFHFVTVHFLNSLVKDA